jgi:hypothetical protein
MPSLGLDVSSELGICEFLSTYVLLLSGIAYTRITTAQFVDRYLSAAGKGSPPPSYVLVGIAIPTTLVDLFCDSKYGLL